MYEYAVKLLQEAKKELENVSKELGLDILAILGNERVSLKPSFPDVFEEKAKELSREDILKFFRAFYKFQSLTLICLDMVIMNGLKDSMNRTLEKKREVEKEIWKNYFEKLMGHEDRLN